MMWKKRIVIGMLALLVCGLCVGCEQKQDEESKFSHYEYTQDAAESRKYEISKEEAIQATARAYYEKGVYVQYDQTWTSRENNDFPARAARWNNSAAPELATSQNNLYVDCSKYQKCLYYNTFGYEIPAEATEEMLDYPELQVLYYEPTGDETAEEEKQICDAVENTLQVGDIVVFRYLDDTNGHVMLYIGDDMLIHSTSTGGGDYTYYDDADNGVVGKTDKEEPNGSIALNSVKTLTTYTESRYLPDKYKFGILRPMKDLTEDDITQDAYCRAAFMQGIVSEVTSDYPTGHTVEPGSEITYTLSFQNIDSVTRKIHVDLSAAEYTKLVTEEISVDIEIESGATETVEFKVKVDEDTALGTMLDAPIVKANGMTVVSVGHEVNKNLSVSESAAFGKVDFSSAEVVDDFSMVQYAYKQVVGKELPFGSVQELFWSLYEFDDYTNISLALKEDGIAREMLVENHYGGLRVKNCGDEPGSRVAKMTGANLQPGDILLVSEDLTPENTYVYLCTAAYNLMQWSPEYGGATLLRTGYMAPVMDALLGQKAYAVLRPSFVLDSNQEKVKLGISNMDAYEGDVMIMGDVEWLDASVGKVEVLTLSEGEKRVVTVQNPSTIPTERLMHMTVSKGYATFADPVSVGLYDNLKADEIGTNICKAAAVSYENGLLTYATDSHTGQIKISTNTRIYQVSNEEQNGRIEEAEVSDEIILSSQSDGTNAQWNIIFKCSKDGSCDWIIVEKNGLDISQCIGLPYCFFVK